MASRSEEAAAGCLIVLAAGAGFFAFVWLMARVIGHGLGLV